MTGKVIHVAFGEQRIFNQSRANFESRLVEAGTILGDDAADVRLRAGRFVDMLQAMSKADFAFEVPKPLIPGPLTAEQEAAIEAAIREAARAGVKKAVLHCVHLAGEASGELCTSLLSRRSK